MLDLALDSQFPWRTLQRLLIVPVWLKESVGAEMPCWMGTPRIMTGILATRVTSWAVARSWFNWHSHTWLGQYGKRIPVHSLLLEWKTHVQIVFRYNDDPLTSVKTLFCSLLSVSRREVEKGEQRDTGVCLESLVGRCTKIRREEGLGRRPLPGYSFPLPKFQFVPVQGL